jgi:hypothetical protein
MLLASLAAFALGATRSNAEVSVSLFYDALEPHGDWVEVSDYGYVWTPRDVGNDWRPYTDGQWAYTDAGWTWVSEEPYGWAVYHYGRWVELDDVGWSWVPDTEWAPAWVSWRHSDKYVGWAPLPPESRETIRVGVNLGSWVDTYYDIGPSYYSFVEVRNLGAPRLRTVLVPPRENITIIQQTTNITNVVVRNNIVVNEGPKYDVVVRQSAQPIRRLKLNREVDFAGDFRSIKGDRFRTRVQGDSLTIPAPRIQAAAGSERLAPKKVARKIETASINRGWKDAGDAQKVEAYRNKLRAESKPPANLPPVARRDRGDGNDRNDRPGAPGADRPTARTGETDNNNRPPGNATRDGRPGDTSRPTVGTGRTGAEDPKRPTADTSAPGADDRNPRANRPGAARRMPADQNRPDATAGTENDSKQPPTSTTDKSRPGAPAATATPDPSKAERPDAKPGTDRRTPTDADMPKRDNEPRGNRPGARPERPDRPGADRPGADRPGGDRPGADRPGADRPRGNRPDAAPDAGDRPPGARTGNPRAGRPAGDRAGGGAGDKDRPEGSRAGAGADRQRQGERARPGGDAQRGGGGAQPGAAAGEKPGKGDKPGKDKKDGE